MLLEHRIGQALHRRGYDAYRLLTWRSRWDRCRPYVIRVSVVLLIAWLMRVVYFGVPEWFWNPPAFLTPKDLEELRQRWIASP